MLEGQARTRLVDLRVAHRQWHWYAQPAICEAAGLAAVRRTATGLLDLERATVEPSMAAASATAAEAAIVAEATMAAAPPRRRLAPVDALAAADGLAWRLAMCACWRWWPRGGLTPLEVAMRAISSDWATKLRRGWRGWHRAMRRDRAYFLDLAGTSAWKTFRQKLAWQTWQRQAMQVASAALMHATACSAAPSFALRLCWICWPRDRRGLPPASIATLHARSRWLGDAWSRWRHFATQHVPAHMSIAVAAAHDRVRRLRGGLLRWRLLHAAAQLALAQGAIRAREGLLVHWSFFCLAIRAQQAASSLRPFALVFAMQSACARSLRRWRGQCVGYSGESWAGGGWVRSGRRGVPKEDPSDPTGYREEPSDVEWTTRDSAGASGGPREWGELPASGAAGSDVGIASVGHAVARGAADVGGTAEVGRTAGGVESASPFGHVSLFDDDRAFGGSTAFGEVASLQDWGGALGGACTPQGPGVHRSPHSWGGMVEALCTEDGMSFGRRSDLSAPFEQSGFWDGGYGGAAPPAAWDSAARDGGTDEVHTRGTAGTTGMGG